MSNLPKKKLGEFIDVRRLKQSGSKPPGSKYIGLEHLNGGCNGINGWATGEISSGTNSLFYEGDTLFGKLRPHLRKCTQAPFDGFCSTDILVLHSREGHPSGFVARIMQSETVFAEAERLSYGTKMPRTSWKDLEDLVVFCPDDDSEQRRIAEILDTADEAIQKTEALIAKLKQMKAGLLHDLLTRGIDENGELRNAKSSPSKFEVIPKIGRKPVDWDVKSGNELSSLITKGESPSWQGFKYQKQGVVFITSENVRDGFLDILKPKFIPELFDEKLSRSRIQPYDVLINLVGASIGRSCMFPPGGPRSNINQAVCLMRPVESWVAEWIFHYLQHPNTIQRLIGEQVESARANVSLTNIREFQFPIPEQHESEEIVRRLNSVDHQVSHEQAYLSKLALLKAGLMNDLLTGEKRVKTSEPVTAH